MRACWDIIHCHVVNALELKSILIDFDAGQKENHNRVHDLFVIVNATIGHFLLASTEPL
jgi:hypothetical protein